MQKKIIALAIAGLVSGAAFAQSNVTIYGRADLGFVHRSSNDGGVAGIEGKNEFMQGVAAGSRIGFRGAEDLGNGNKAIFQFEYGTGLDENVGLTTIRNAYVGFTGGWGTAVGGRLDGVRYGIYNKYDAFAGGTIGNFTQITAQVDRANNAVAYISPKFGGGFTFTGAYATNIGNSNPLGLNPTENAGNDGDGKLTTLMLNYANGPIEATADWERVSFSRPRTAAGFDAVPALVNDITVWTFGASYDFGVVKVRGLYDVLQRADRDNSGVDEDTRSWFLSATAPIGANWLLKATYGRTNDTTGVKAANDDARKWGLGVNYMMSKRTTIYADYGHISQGSGSAIGLSPAANAMNSAAAQYGTRGFDVGVAHTF